MNKILVLVEGQTEEQFVKRVLAPEFSRIGLVPTIIRTKTTGARPNQGGTVPYGEFKRQIRLLLRDPRAVLVTTLLDYQGLGTDFPGRERPVGNSAIARAEHVEWSIKKDLDHPRFHPFLLLHEFEAFLFADLAIMDEVFQEPGISQELQPVWKKYSTPEEINDSAATSPSKRIQDACKKLLDSRDAYQKSLHGPQIAWNIGLAKIRAKRPHFNAWLSHLEIFLTLTL